MLNPAAFSAARVRPTAMGRLHPATRLAGLTLGLVWAMTAPLGALTGVLVLVQGCLIWTGLPPRRQWSALRRWSFMAVLVVVTHTLTTVSAAPLGHPSLTGLLAGTVALARVAASLGLLALYLRVTSHDELVSGLAWWLRPLRRLGLPVQDLGLVLAVALGTVSVVTSEGRRIEMVVRMRRAGGSAIRTRSWWRTWVVRTVDRARVVVPLLEALGRRADGLGLSLRRRRPQDAGDAGPLPWRELAALVVAWGLFFWGVWRKLATHKRQSRVCVCAWIWPTSAVGITAGRFSRRCALCRES